jgi:hypothetical protein
VRACVFKYRRETLDLDVCNFVWRSNSYKLYVKTFFRNIATMRNFEGACAKFLCLNEYQLCIIMDHKRR